MAEQAFMALTRGHSAQVEASLRRCLDGLAEVVPKPVHAAAAAAVLSGGKRLRPLLCVTACEELGGAPRHALYDLAASIEVIHAYSLVHDDLPCMDDAELRRGRPTVHVSHGVAVATAAGAALIPWAAAWALDAAMRLARTDGEARRIVATLLEAAGAGGMIGGQALDLLAEGASLTEGELAGVHGLKTGALLAASLEMGAMAAGASAEELAAVGGFGRHLGLAFQVMDDVLDATGSAEVLGKLPSDADFGKSTYVLLLGVNGARERAASLVDRGLAALDDAGLAAPMLRSLASFVIERSR
ncbi:MAG: polyprenyl synthetase family protein [Gemmatimonadota bacterium]|nr:polyprenyl synthetase family protein [Gemmatimonadota bacterium]MDE2866893.1 polyprenyl synthetase family protein [Gemmatimonadota bacterium]